MNIKSLQNLFLISKGFRKSIILLTANRIGVFNCIRDKKLTVDQIIESLKMDKRGMIILLNALVGLGVLKNRKELYSIKKPFRDFLIEGSKFYIGASLEHDFNLLESWSNLPVIMKTGKPIRKKNEVRSKKEQENFILTMANSATPLVEDLFSSLDLSKYKTFLDVGGGPGVFALFACKKFPNLTSTNFDIPETIAISRNYLKKFPESSKIKLVEGNYFSDPLGENFDVVFISSIIHSLGENDIKMLFRKSFSAMNESGMIIVKDFYFNKDRTAPERASLFSVNMFVNTEEGNCYTVDETKKWLKESGFRNTKYFKRSTDLEFITAIK